MKTITSSQSLTVLMFLVAACGGSSSLGGGEESGGAGGSGSATQGTGGTGAVGSGGSGTGGTATGGSSGNGTGGSSTGGSAGKGTGGTATGGTGGSATGGTGGSATGGTGGSATGGTGGTGTGGTGGAPPINRPECLGNITFADPAIEKYVAGLVGKQPPLRGADVAGITEIQYEWTEIAPPTSLRGLQCLGSLRSFFAFGPDLRTLGYLDLTALSELPQLSTVSLDGVRMTDYGDPLTNLNIAPLSRNQAITDLAITSESLNDVSSVANLVNLKAIVLNGDRITDLSSLEHLPLKRASIFSRGVTDITPVAAALRANQGTSFGAIRSSVVDWSPVLTITSLTNLGLSGSKTVELSTFASLPALLSMNARDAKLTQVAAPPTLRALDISGNPTIASYEPLVNANVRNLTVRRNEIKDLTPFLGITSLHGGGSLDVMENPIDCATQTANIQTLRSNGVLVSQDCLP